MSQTPPGGQTMASPPPPAPQRLLRRATRDRWLGGVATGFARYLGIDPVLARIGIVVLGLILWWPVLVLYVVCLFVIPADDAPDARNPDHFVDRHGKTLGIVTGVILLLALLGTFDSGRGPWHPPWAFFVLLVAAPVLFVVWLVRRGHGAQENPDGTQQYSGSWPGGSAGGVTWSGGTWSATRPTFGGPGSVSAPAAARPPYPGAPQPVREPVTTPPSGAGGPGGPGGPDPTAQFTAYPGPIPPTPYPAAAYTAAPYFPTPDPSWKPRERSALGPLTVGAGLVTAGTLVALDRTDALDVPTVVVLGSALAVVGLGLVVGGFFGRARGLIGLGIVLAIATTLASVVQLPASNSVGDQAWKPLTVAEVAPTYEWGMGEAKLDLTALSTAKGSTVSTKVELGVGELKIVVPRNATLDLNGKVGMGAIDVVASDGTKQTFDGISREADVSFVPAEPLRSTGPTIDLDVSVGIGHVEVSRA